jgi:hypothetical protein
LPGFNGLKIEMFNMAIENSSQWNAVVNGNFQLLKIINR